MDTKNNNHNSKKRLLDTLLKLDGLGEKIDEMEKFGEIKGIQELNYTSGKGYINMEKRIEMNEGKIDEFNKNYKELKNQTNNIKGLMVGVVVVLFVAFIGILIDVILLSPIRDNEFYENEIQRNDRVAEIEHQISSLTNIVKNSEKTMDAKIDSALLEYMSNSN